MDGSVTIDPAAQAPGPITLAYDSFGDPADPAILLVMGLGTQRIAWPDPFCDMLAAGGFRVIRFDNRDIGESTHLDGVPAPTPVQIALRRRPAAYHLDALAADVIGLIEQLGLAPVHLVGASMGGFISQLVAVSRPDLLASLTLIMTSTGSRRVGGPSIALIRQILRRRPMHDRDSAVAATVTMTSLISGSGFPFPQAEVEMLAGISYDRGYDPAGQLRQFGAVLAQTDRTPDLRRLRTPTLVMHGLDDPLVAPSGGLAVAKAIPGAIFIGLPGMGHTMPRELWPTMTDQMLTHIRTTNGR